MKVTSTKNISFPKLNWGINKGEVRELPEEKDVAEIILANPVISEVKANSTKTANSQPVESEEKDAKEIK